jgi:hypothetical protein
MTNTIIIVSLLLGIAGLFAIGFLVASLLKLDKRVSKLETENEEAKIERARIQAEKEAKEKFLEEAKGRERPHHSYDTLATLENAMAVVWDIELNNQATSDRLNTLLAMLQQARVQPNKSKPHTSKGVNGNG